MKYFNEIKADTTKSIVFNADCMEVMKEIPDKFFNLAICDTPYGIKESSKAGKRPRISVKYKICNWDDNSPDKDFFKELFRVSKNQIIWGANHFISKIPFDSSCWIIWDKIREKQDFADCELAWTSFKTSVKQFTFAWDGFRQGYKGEKEVRIHPTQKPVALYEWILKNYSNKDDIILDTHLGSGSNRIACYKAGLSFIGCEIDKDYYEAQEKRYKDFKSQLTIFPYGNK